MSRNIFVEILEGITISGGGTKAVYLDLSEAENLQLLSQITTVGTSGVTLSLYYGFGQSDPTATGSLPTLVDVAPAGVIFGDTATVVAVETTVGTVFFLNDVRKTCPRWIKLLYTNTDGSHPATLSLYGDM